MLQQPSRAYTVDDDPDVTIRTGSHRHVAVDIVDRRHLRQRLNGAQRIIDQRVLTEAQL
jgi:hypothetical protein